MSERVVNILEVLNILGFWIWLWFWIFQGSEYTTVMNMPGFWIYQGYEYARVLDMPRFGICLNSEYIRVANISRFWICQGSKYTKVLNIPGLYRPLSAPEYPWKTSEYAWLSLNIPKYAWIYQDMCEYG